MENEIFLYAGCAISEQFISIAIGTRSSKRRVRLSETDALKLAYKLMSYAAGGSTDGRVVALSEI